MAYKLKLCCHLKYYLSGTPLHSLSRWHLLASGRLQFFQPIWTIVLQRPTPGNKQEHSRCLLSCLFKQCPFKLIFRAALPFLHRRTCPMSGPGTEWPSFAHALFTFVWGADCGRYAVGHGIHALLKPLKVQALTCHSWSQHLCMSLASSRTWPRLHLWQDMATSV